MRFLYLSWAYISVHKTVHKINLFLYSSWLKNWCQVIRVSAMVWFFTILTILVTESNKCFPIFRSDNQLEITDGNCKDKLKGEVFQLDFCAVMHYPTHIWIIPRLYYFLGSHIGQSKNDHMATGCPKKTVVSALCTDGMGNILR